MGIPFTVPMGFLFTMTIGFLFTIALGIQLTISSYSLSGIAVTHGLPPRPMVPDFANKAPAVPSKLDPFSEQRGELREWEREYNTWLQENERKGKLRKETKEQK